MKWLKIVGGVLLVLFLAMVVFKTLFNNPGRAGRGSQTGSRVSSEVGSGIDAATPPQIIAAHFMPLEELTTISKFRSGAGHDFSDDTSPCSSMKHYFQPAVNEEYQKTHSLPPPPDGVTDIPIVSPVNGTIRSIEGENVDFGRQIYITVAQEPSMIVRLFHIFPDPHVKRGLNVKSGDRLGVIGGYQGTDIAVQTGFGPSARFISYFDVMSDNLFANYASYGITSRDQLKFSKEHRDANPLRCQGEQFVGTNRDHASSEDYVALK